MFRPEILAPAGNLFKLQTALRYGADAVYLAGDRFGLRAGADNFSDEELRQAGLLAREAGVKLYVVLNGFLFDEELEQLRPFLDLLAEIGVDAVIVSDLGVVRTVAQHGRLTIHLSTQASTLNGHAARFWRDQGVKRIVLGRETSIEQAAAIKRAGGLEVELFVHGAMCMAYSGNCTISNYTAGRDSNRGGCIQSCRFRYTLSNVRDGDGPSDYFMSSKDLRAVEHMRAFIEHEIDSLKIEGRMKSALYVATTARAYAGARDALLQEREPDVAALFAELDQMSHRDYTDASLLHKAGPDSVYLAHTHDSARYHALIGHVVDVRPEHIALLLNAPLEAGQPCEFLDRDGRWRPLDTHAPRDLAGNPIAKGKPNSVVLLPHDPAAEVSLLVRKGAA